jgi:uncharacterized protein YdeI (YjbR/CyaY-like superfamily)
VHRLLAAGELVVSVVERVDYAPPESPGVLTRACRDPLGIPTSPWSKVNKTKIKALEDADRIQPAGAAAVQAAKTNGSWTILDDAQNHIVPDDLSEAFVDQGARNNFDQLSPSRRRNVLCWIALAKRDDTRRRRIQQTADAAANAQAPNNF